MDVYYFHASGYDQVGEEDCSDDAAAERAAFQMSMELSRCANRLVVVTVKNERGEQVCSAPILSDSDLQHYIAAAAFTEPAKRKQR